jgi:Fuc2NAc and GlcNAc transferase
MVLECLVLILAIVIASMAMTAVVRRNSLRRGALDIPNARSSHMLPTPRGGGIAIVATSIAGLAALAAAGILDVRPFLALAGGGAAIALVGHLDDRGRIGILGRFIAHIGAAVWATVCIGGITEVQWGSEALSLGHGGSILTVIGIVWALNLFNFMDGIDGIAASQAMFMAGGGALLGILAGLAPAISAVGFVIAAASFGFLWWNWPPARIFMGDVGSGYLGFVLAVLALMAFHERAVMLPVWLILGGLFFIDATMTLARRMARRERVYVAHRSHAYQWQARRWHSHLRVTAGFWLLNLLWLAPWAWLCVRFPSRAGWYLAAAWGPLLVLAIVCGSGRREASPTPPC